VRRPGNEIQYILRSSDGEIERIQFGRNTADMPLAAPVLTRMQATISNESGARGIASDAEPQAKRAFMTPADINAEEVR
jgi:hypothetical protein